MRAFWTITYWSPWSSSCRPFCLTIPSTAAPGSGWNIRWSAARPSSARCIRLMMSPRSPRSLSVCCHPSSKRQEVGEMRSTSCSLSSTSRRPIAWDRETLRASAALAISLIWMVRSAEVRGGQRPIDPRQPLLRYLAIELPPHVELGAWPKFLRGQLLSAQAQRLGQIGPIDPQLAVLSVDAAHDQMDVRIIGVVVADGRPAQPAAEILLHPLDQVARVPAQIELVAVLGRDDESKLAFLAFDGRREFLAPDVAVGIEHLARRAVPLDAVAFDVTEMSPGRLGAAASEADITRLDDASPCVGRQAYVALRRAPFRRAIRPDDRGPLPSARSEALEYRAPHSEPGRRLDALATAPHFRAKGPLPVARRIAAHRALLGAGSLGLVCGAGEPFSPSPSTFAARRESRAIASDTKPMKRSNSVTDRRAPAARSACDHCGTYTNQYRTNIANASESTSNVRRWSAESRACRSRRRRIRAPSLSPPSRYCSIAASTAALSVRPLAPQ